MATNRTPDEWYECLSQGTAAVRRTYEIPEFRRRGIPRLSVYHIPSFTDCFGWTIYEIPGRAVPVEVVTTTKRKGEYKLQTVKWRQSADAEKFKQHMAGALVGSSRLATPTMEESFSDIDSEWVEREIANLAQIRIPLITRAPFGCDGVSYGVHVRGLFDLEWWCDGPSEWKELAIWTHRWIESMQAK
jgi:hypothetical protein